MFAIYEDFFYFLCLLIQGFKTKDGYIVVAAGNDQQFVKVCKVSRIPPSC